MLLLVFVIWTTVSRLSASDPSTGASSPVKRTLGNTSTDPLTSIETSARVTEANAKTLTSTPQRPHTQRIPSALLITRLLSWRRRIPTLLSRLFGHVRLHYVLSFAQTSPPRNCTGGRKAASSYSKVDRLSSGKGGSLLQNRRGQPAGAFRPPAHSGPQGYFS